MLMEPSTKGFSPEQIATGTLETGKDVIIIYVKEFVEQLNRVSQSGKVGYFYTWSRLPENDSDVIFIYWDNEEEIAVVFGPKQHYVVESLKMPKDLVITAMPINRLVEQAQQAGHDFIDLKGPVVYLNDVVFKESEEIPS